MSVRADGLLGKVPALARTLLVITVTGALRLPAHAQPQPELFTRPARPAARPDPVRPGPSSDPADGPVDVPGSLPLRAPDQTPSTLAALMGAGYKLLVFLKPWAPETPRVIETYSQYKHRLNKEPLATALVFVNTRPEEAREAARGGEQGLRVLLDDGGRVARQLKVRTVPSLVLISPGNQVIFRTAYLSDFLIRQIASDYPNPASLKDAKENRWAIPGVPGFGAQGP